MAEAFAGLVFCALPLALVILVSVLVRRGRERRLAEHWRALQVRHADLRGTAHLATVETVYQHARRGSKAIIRWAETGHRQDTWFAGCHPQPGSHVLLSGSTGWGPHNNNPETYYVNPGDLLFVAPPEAPAAAQRAARRAAKR